MHLYSGFGIKATPGIIIFQAVVIVAAALYVAKIQLRYWKDRFNITDLTFLNQKSWLQVALMQFLLLAIGIGVLYFRPGFTSGSRLLAIVLLPVAVALANYLEFLGIVLPWRLFRKKQEEALKSDFIRPSVPVTPEEVKIQEVRR